MSFNRHPPLGANATHSLGTAYRLYPEEFQSAPALRGECYARCACSRRATSRALFQSAPALRGECYRLRGRRQTGQSLRFQSAPALRGECYRSAAIARRSRGKGFNRHPPLGANATVVTTAIHTHTIRGFNRHPPLGANATTIRTTTRRPHAQFQSAPALRGECYTMARRTKQQSTQAVSIGTRP